jgi:hypothetical protein
LWQFYALRITPATEARLADHVWTLEELVFDSGTQGILLKQLNEFWSAYSLGIRAHANLKYERLEAIAHLRFFLGLTSLQNLHYAQSRLFGSYQCSQWSKCILAVPALCDVRPSGTLA